MLAKGGHKSQTTSCSQNKFCLELQKMDLGISLLNMLSTHVFSSLSFPMTLFLEKSSTLCILHAITLPLINTRESLILVLVAQKYLVPKDLHFLTINFSLILYIRRSELLTPVVTEVSNCHLITEAEVLVTLLILSGIFPCLTSLWLCLLVTIPKLSVYSACQNCILKRSCFHYYPLALFLLDSLFLWWRMGENKRRSNFF